ncbi:MAG: CRISPR-associated endonuclease Cas2 [Verrucomicrobiae bacterium]|nr:CRISPR-associated endonuclease Cas2 [Verrucomicrobiae bacterium]
MAPKAQLNDPGPAPRPRRLNRVARTCEDFGVRVQYSVFECHLEEHELARLWAKLTSLIDPTQDRIVAYRLDAHCARQTLTAGTMVCSERVVCYLV